MTYKLGIAVFICSSLSTLLVARPPMFEFESLMDRPIVPNQQFLETLTYRAENNGNFAYEIAYTISKIPSKNEDYVRIDTQVVGPDIYETNLVYITYDGEVRVVYQESQNHMDNVFFKWQVDNRTRPAKAILYHSRSKRIERSKVNFPTNGYPIQALVFLLNNRSDSDNMESISFKLLIPPAKFIPLVTTLIGDGEESFDDKTYPVHIVDIGLPGILSYLMPKYRFWISKAPPKVVMRYKYSTFDVRLVGYEKLAALPALKAAQ